MRSVELSVATVAGAIALGIGLILTAGLLGGFVGRDGKCVAKEGGGALPSAATQPTTTQGGQQQQTTMTTTTTTAGAGATTTRGPTVSFTLPETATPRTLPGVTNATRITTTTRGEPEFAYRLPGDVRPTKYDLTIKTYFDPYKLDRKNNEQVKFNGEVTITFEAKQATSKLILHMDRILKLTESNIQISNVQTNQNVQVSRHGFLPNQLYELVLAASLQSGQQYRVTLKYEGETLEEGFYKVDFLDNFKYKSLLGTRFAPDLARTAFPCFDEPEFKAEFDITIEHPEFSFALSNFPVQDKSNFQESGQTRWRTKFRTTFKLSPHLIGWAVLPDDFDFRTATASNGLEIRVYGKGETIKKDFGRFALEVAEKTLNYLIDYLGPENLRALPPKIDLLGLPDFPEEASENLGLNSFHEDDLFYSPKEDTLDEQERVAEIVAHEIAHHWTGSHVGCSWWEDLWLNEGLSTFLEYKALNSLYPTWDFEDQFLTDHTIPFLWEDGFISSRPVKLAIESSEDLEIIEDEITESKGPAIIRMFERVIGEDNFRAGLRKYLSDNAFGTADADKFYSSFQAANGVNPSIFLNAWLTTPNTPKVKIFISTVSGVTRVNLEQEAFLLSQDEEVGIPKDRVWPIYLECKAGGDQSSPLNGNTRDFTYNLNSKTGSINLDRVYNWVKCNKDFRSIYMTDYQKSFFESFDSVLENKPDTFSAGDRSNLLHVSFALAYLGADSYYVPSLMTNFLRAGESELTPWRTAIWYLNKLGDVLEHRASFKNLREFSLEIANEAISRLDYNIYDDAGEHNVRLLKVTLVDFLCRMLDAKCLNLMTTLFKSINTVYFLDPLNTQNAVLPNHRPLAYKYHIENTYNYRDWFKLYDLYSNTDDLNTREHVVDALAATPLSWFYAIFFDEVLNDASRIDPEDLPRIIAQIGNNPAGRYFAWYFIREYWIYLSRAFGQSKELSDAVKQVVETFDNVLLLEELIEFYQQTYDENPLIRLKAFDHVLNNILWVINKENDFMQFFGSITKKNLIA